MLRLRLGNYDMYHKQHDVNNWMTTRAVCRICNWKSPAYLVSDRQLLLDGMETHRVNHGFYLLTVQIKGDGITYFKWTVTQSSDNTVSHLNLTPYQLPIRSKP